MWKIVLAGLWVDLLVLLSAIFLSHLVLTKFMSAGEKTLKKRILSCIYGFMVVYGLYFIHILYWPSPPETKCGDLADISVVFAPAFTALGKDPSTGKYIPGAANEQIANKIKECRFGLVLTQKAVSDAFRNEEELRQYHVEQMHKEHPVIEVRTVEALYRAVERAEDFLAGQKKVGLIAQAKHVPRARQALEAALQAKYPGAPIEIVNIHLGKPLYQDKHLIYAWRWGVREIFARPYQCFQLLIRNFHPTGGVRLEKISKRPSADSTIDDDD